MRVQALGHVVLKVRDLERSEVFYSDILRMRVVSRISDPPMTFFRTATSDHHHDFALMELSLHTPPPYTNSIIIRPKRSRSGACGLRDRSFGRGVPPARSVLDASGTQCLYEVDWAFAKSVHVLDPDGNEGELYIDTLGHWDTRTLGHSEG